MRVHMVFLISAILVSAMAAPGPAWAADGSAPALARPGSVEDVVIADATSPGTPAVIVADRTASAASGPVGAAWLSEVRSAAIRPPPVPAVPVAAPAPVGDATSGKSFTALIALLGVAILGWIGLRVGRWMTVRQAEPATRLISRNGKMVVTVGADAVGAVRTVRDASGAARIVADPVTGGISARHKATAPAASGTRRHVAEATPAAGSGAQRQVLDPSGAQRITTASGRVVVIAGDPTPSRANAALPRKNA
ncbi:MAG TPA: hypothetical protein VEL07_02965 [Planctomycetota bacterium]|nr:hypothetical protein [Planctomycetota bacterium]